MSNKVVILSAPSGAGKTTIVRNLLRLVPGLEFSVSACSRLPRPNEINGKDYYFINIQKFKEKIANDEFLEWQEVYPGNFYGSLKSEVSRIWQKNHDVIFDVDVMGGLNIKKIYQAQALAVFIQPPSIEILKERLIHRGTETPEIIKKRIEKASYEMKFAEKFDLIIVNYDLNIAINKAEKAIWDFII